MVVSWMYEVHQIRHVASKDADEAGKCHCKAEFLSLRDHGNKGRFLLTGKKETVHPFSIKT